MKRNHSGLVDDREEKLTEQWLDLRQLADDQARSSELLKAALAHDSSLTGIVDLGAGTGNNTLYMLKRLQKPYQIVLVEKHENLLAQARNRITRFLQASPPRSAIGGGNQTLTESNHSLRLQGSRGELSVQFVCDDIFNWLKTSESAVYTCSALLDLLTKAELTELLESVQRTASPLLCALNYSGAQYYPSDPDDAECLSLFEMHMSRELQKGRPLGAKTRDFLDSHFQEQLNCPVLTAASDWNIRETQQRFLRMNLDFHRLGATAMGGMSTAPSVDSWALRRLDQIDKQALSLAVRHWDYLMLPAS